MSPTPSVPAGYARVETQGVSGLAESAAAPWIEDQLRTSPSLYAAVSSRAADSTPLGGRGAVRFIAAPDGDGEWAVRHSMRGGLLAPLWVDRYARVGTPRPIAELQASVRLIEAGIATPRVIAALTYPAGLVYRGDVVTRRVPGIPLVEVLRGSDPGSTAALLEHVASVIARISAAGAIHVDLNAHNILVDASAETPVWVLDLDGMTFGGDPSRTAPAMAKRLLRSLKKLGTDDEVMGLAAQAFRVAP